MEKLLDSCREIILGIQPVIASALPGYDVS